MSWPKTVAVTSAANPNAIAPGARRRMNPAPLFAEKA
jgi:hypothetical protein